MTLNAQPESNNHLRGRWLLVARAMWLTVTLLTLGLFVASLPTQYEYYRTPCTNAVCDFDDQLTPERLQALQAFGLSADFYAAYATALDVVFAAVYLAIASVIFAHKSDDGLALFVALMLVMFGVGTAPSDLDNLAANHSAWWLPVRLVQFIGDASILIFFYIFPNGQFAPRWTRVLAVVWTVTRVPVYFFPQSPFNDENWPSLLSGLVFSGFVSTGLFAQVYRYWRVSNPLQRQQTKWVVFGVTAALVGILALSWTLTITPSLLQNVLIWLAGNTAFYLFLLLIPLSIGLAILRSRLWDIDVIIRRTLIYGTLTAALALVYIGSVVLLQSVFRALTGQTSQLVIVASTLAIAALFNPLRRRVQDVIDRRFYRRKYDAEQTLAAFATTARDEVDLDTLTQELVRVMQETMQPAHVSVWLKERPGKENSESGLQSGLRVER